MDGYVLNKRKRRNNRHCIRLGFYLFHESMLESVIYARDHFLVKTSSIQMFPSHAYLVR